MNLVRRVYDLELYKFIIAQGICYTCKIDGHTDTKVYVNILGDELL